MTYYFWDMDHTIIDNDCDVSWKQYLVAKGIADSDQLKMVDEFYRQYAEGVLKVDEYLAFQLQEFAGRTVEDVRALCTGHFEALVKDKIYPRAVQMMDEQRDGGGRLILMTATNVEIARPLAEYLGMDDMVASLLEMSDGMFNGCPTGVYNCGEGKVTRLSEYCNGVEVSPADVHYFGDSLSDRFVLDFVGHPHAVNPMPALRKMAGEKGWDVIDFKDGG